MLWLNWSVSLQHGSIQISRRWLIIWSGAFGCQCLETFVMLFPFFQLTLRPGHSFSFQLLFHLCVLGVYLNKSRTSRIYSSSVSWRESISIFPSICPYCIIKLLHSDAGSWTGERNLPARKKLVKVDYVIKAELMLDQRFWKSKPWIHTKHSLSDLISICLSEGLVSTVSKALCCFQNENSSSVYKLIACLNWSFDHLYFVNFLTDS